jgi:hypothetical protein
MSLRTNGIFAVFPVPAGESTYHSPVKLILGALVVVVAVTACTTPAPEPTPSSAPTTTSRFVDAQSLQGRYNRFVEALNSKNDDATGM